jgi:hypothetical protein
VNRRARRRLAIVLATAALSAAVGAYKPLDRRAAAKAFAEGVAAVQGSDLGAAVEAFTACLAARPGRADCEAGLSLAQRTLAAEDAARRAAADSKVARIDSEVEALAARLGGRVNPDGTLDLSFRPPTVQGRSSEAASEPSEEDRRRAIKHWNEGIKAFQKGDMSAAKDHWTLCGEFDPSNEECVQGLTRLARTYGGGQ